jgi:(4S)-4-hydroxy-5-phosphonooxypentane-2,3-dione isomerase
MYVIIAPIQLKQGYKEQFIESVTEDARSSVRDEPGCLRFDVIQDANVPQPHLALRSLQG